MSKLSSISLEDKLANSSISSNQYIALNEILAASKIKNKKGRRYSELTMYVTSYTLSLWI